MSLLKILSSYRIFAFEARRFSYLCSIHRSSFRENFAHSYFQGRNIPNLQIIFRVFLVSLSTGGMSTSQYGDIVQRERAGNISSLILPCLETFTQTAFPHVGVSCNSHEYLQSITYVLAEYASGIDLVNDRSIFFYVRKEFPLE